MLLTKGWYDRPGGSMSAQRTTTQKKNVSTNRTHIFMFIRVSSLS
jgi:hypothetical protein